MDYKDEIKLERRIAAAKRNYPDWIEFDPDKFVHRPPEERVKERVVLSNNLCKRWKDGFFIDDEWGLAAVWQNGTIHIISQPEPETLGPSMREMVEKWRDWLRKLKNVRKIFQKGRVLLALHTDGGVSFTVLDSYYDDGASSREADELRSRLSQMNDWRDVRDIYVNHNAIMAYTGSGALKGVSWKDGKAEQWAAEVPRGVSSIRGAGYYSDIFCYKCKTTLSFRGEDDDWFQLVKQMPQKEKIQIVLGEHYVAAYDGGTFTVKAVSKPNTVDVSAASKWRYVSVIVNYQDTIVGITANGSVVSAGEKAWEIENWTNAVLLTATPTRLYCIRQDGSVYCSDRKMKPIKVNFSWIVKEGE